MTPRQAGQLLGAVHHDTAGPVVVQLRGRVVACTAVDDPPPKQDGGPARGAVRAFGRRSDDGLQRTPLLLWRHRSSRRRLSSPNYPLQCAQGGQVFRRAASTPRRSAEPWRRRRPTRIRGDAELTVSGTSNGRRRLRLRPLAGQPVPSSGGAPPLTTVPSPGWRAYVAVKCVPVRGVVGTLTRTGRAGR